QVTGVIHAAAQRLGRLLGTVPVAEHRGVDPGPAPRARGRDTDLADLTRLDGLVLLVEDLDLDLRDRFPAQTGPRCGAAVGASHGGRRLGHAVADRDLVSEALTVERAELLRTLRAADLGPAQRRQVLSSDSRMGEEVVEDRGDGREVTHLPAAHPL